MERADPAASNGQSGAAVQDRAASARRTGRQPHYPEISVAERGGAPNARRALAEIDLEKLPRTPRQHAVADAVSIRRTGGRISHRRRLERPGTRQVVAL